MPHKITTIAVLLCSMFFLNVNAADEARTSFTHEIDVEVWNVLADTVKNHDIVKMGSTYLSDAVLVSPKGTDPISTTLERWGRDMRVAQAKGNAATVAFRFSRRQDNAETAFESGIFKYTVIEKSGSMKSTYYPFEQLLLRKDGKWRVLMEHQFPEVTEGDWNKLSPQ